MVIKNAGKREKMIKTEGGRESERERKRAKERRSKKVIERRILDDDRVYLGAEFSEAIGDFSTRMGGGREGEEEEDEKKEEAEEEENGGDIFLLTTPAKIFTTFMLQFVFVTRH